MMRWALEALCVLAAGPIVYGGFRGRFGCQLLSEVSGVDACLSFARECHCQGVHFGLPPLKMRCGESIASSSTTPAVLT